MYADRTRPAGAEHALPALHELLVSVAEVGPVRLGAAVLVALMERTPDGPERDALIRALSMLAPAMFDYEHVTASAPDVGAAPSRAMRMALVREDVERRAVGGQV